MPEWITILFKAFWCGWAAVGFGILFNVPMKNLIALWIGGAIVGFTKFSVLFITPSSIVLASFLASLAVGIYSVIIAHTRNETAMIFAIPSVIPLVPGAFAYRTMFGLIRLSGKVGDDFSGMLSQTVHNGAITLFIIMAFTIGVIIPIQIKKEIEKRLSKRQPAVGSRQ